MDSIIKIKWEYFQFHIDFDGRILKCNKEQLPQMLESIGDILKFWV